MILNEFSMKYEGYNDIKCSVPCSLYSVLLENKLIDNPYIGINERKYKELSEKDCEFYTTFEITEKEINDDFTIIRFNCIDTLSTIRINGHKVAETDNMHRIYEFDIKPYLKKGKNTLNIHISSPLNYIEERNKKHFVWTNEDTVKGAAHLRKASYMMGWDWAPILPDMGILRPVEIISYNDDMIDNVLVRQIHNNGRVTLKFKVFTKKHIIHNFLALFDGKEYKFCDNEFEIEVDNPRLWWPNGMGEQTLYAINVSMMLDGKAIDSWKRKIGLRTLSVSTEEDKYGNEFCFVINGEKIFAMGADYVPQDSIIPFITKKRTEKLIAGCVDANFNCIRVWGGQYYPDDDFYDLCDEKGLIVWQDFMFACINVYLTDNFRKTVIEEAKDNIKRIRHHASLGLLCGNNEMELFVNEYEFGRSQLVKNDYIELYERILPDICDEYAPDTFYWPSSPSNGGGFDDPGNENKGDVHFWSVWHGGVEFTEYRKHNFRFCSEFGFESFPSIKTVKTFAKDEDLNIFSEVMENHQKCKSGNSKILNYLASEYLYCTDFENLIYASCLNQGNAIRYGVEHFRRMRGRCMGATYWQLNDCWPVASWSSIDYYGRYKALHYMAKRFFAPTAVFIFYEDNQITVTVTNEKLDEFRGHIKFSIKDNHLKTVYEKCLDVNSEKLSSKDVLSVNISEYIEHYKESRFAVCELFNEKGDRLSKSVCIFVKPKRFKYDKPEISVNVTKKGEMCCIQLCADVFAQNVEIDFCETDLILSDNYFDITDNSVIEVYAKTDMDVNEIKKQLRIRSVYDIR